MNSYRHSKTKIVKWLVPLALLLLTQTTFAWESSSDDGETVYTTFTPDDHGAGEISTSIIEDGRGHIFVGNEGGLLKFDGENWSLMPKTGQSSYIVSVAKENNENIWVTSLKSLGYYSPNEQGEYTYNDVTHSIKSAVKDKELGTFWKLYTRDNSIFLITSEHVLRWNQDKWRSWAFKEERRILPSWTEDGLYIHARGTGVFHLVGEEFEQIAEHTPEVASGIISILGNTEHGLLCATVTNGLFYLNQGTYQRAFPKLSAYQILHAHTSKSGDIILSTTHDGVVIINTAGKVIRHIEQTDSPVYYTMEDSHGTIWSAGIGAILEIPDLPITYFSDAAHDILRHHKNLYYTNGSTLKTIPNDSASPTPHIVAQGTTIWDLHSIGSDLLYGDLGSFNSIHQLETPTRTQTARQVGSFSPSWTDPNIVYTSDLPKVSRWKKTAEGWQYLDSLREFNSGALSVAELPNSKLLISGENAPLLLADWDAPHPITALGKESGLPKKFIWAHILQQEELIIVISDQGLFRYDSHSEKFNYDPILGNDIGNDAYALEYCPTTTHTGWVVYLPKTDENINPIGKLTLEKEQFNWVPYHLPSLELAGNVKALFQEINDQSDEILWVGGSKKILRYNIPQIAKEEDPTTSLTHIREQNTNQVYYNGAGPAPDSLSFDFPHNSLRIEYAARPSPINVKKYQTRLTGFNQSWSEPHKFTFREFTNLASGSYTFETRAIDEFGRTGKSATLKLVILPPWYQTPYAYLIYVALSLCILAGLNQLKHRGLRLRNERLTDLVNQRTHELETEKQKLLKANKAKQNFLASISHEIRNPLNGIIGIAHLLKQQEEDKGTPSEETTHLYSCSQHLNQLLTQTLDYSSLEAGKLRTRFESFAPCELLQEVIQIQNGMAQEKGILLKLETPQIKHNWKGDPVLLRQILINLVSNGIKYTKQGSVKLILSYQEKEDTVIACFETIDTGPGVPKEHEHMIFEEFARLPESEMSHIPGTGLGLTISSEMARLMGGRLKIDTDYEGGARFLLEIEFGIELFRRKKKFDEAENQSEFLKGKRALIADDMGFNRYISAAVLNSMGAVIDVAENGLIALNKLNSSTYDIAILDINMPEMTGIEVVESYLKKQHDDTPIFIALSAYITPDAEEKGMTAGFNYFIEKPLDPDKLKKHLNYHHRKSRTAKGSDLLDYLSKNGPMSLKELQSEYTQTLKDEVKKLQTALLQDERKEQQDTIHKLLGLCRIQKCDAICTLVESISQKSKQGATKGEITALIEQLKTEIDRAASGT